MTQREKLTKAIMMAQRIKSVAHSLRNDARDYDCRFPIPHADTLENIADNFLKMFK